MDFPPFMGRVADPGLDPGDGRVGLSAATPISLDAGALLQTPPL